MRRLVSIDGGYLSVIPGILAMGMGLCTTESTEAIATSLTGNRQRVAPALNDVTREFDIAPGAVFLGTVLSAGYRNAEALALTARPSFVEDWQHATWAGVAVMAVLRKVSRIPEA